MFQTEHFPDQLARIDRLLEIMNSENQISSLGRALHYQDIVIFCFQSMWHMKDWLLNDPAFNAQDLEAVGLDIYSCPALMICADIANKSKHWSLTSPKTDASLSPRAGIHFNSREGIHQEFYYVSCEDRSDPYHWAEVRTLLMDARKAWDDIINKHYCTKGL